MDKLILLLLHRSNVFNDNLQKIPGAWLVQFKEAGHGLMHQYPEQLSTVLQTFFNTTTTTSMIPFSNATSNATAAPAGNNTTTTTTNTTTASPTLNSTSTTSP